MGPAAILLPPLIIGWFGLVFIDSFIDKDAYCSLWDLAGLVLVGLLTLAIPLFCMAVGLTMGTHGRTRATDDSRGLAELRYVGSRGVSFVLFIMVAGCISAAISNNLCEEEHGIEAFLPVRNVTRSVSRQIAALELSAWDMTGGEILTDATAPELSTIGVPSSGWLPVCALLDAVGLGLMCRGMSGMVEGFATCAVSGYKLYIHLYRCQSYKDPGNRPFCKSFYSAGFSVLRIGIVVWMWPAWNQVRLEPLRSTVEQLRTIALQICALPATAVWQCLCTVCVPIWAMCFILWGMLSATCSILWGALRREILWLSTAALGDQAEVYLYFTCISAIVLFGLTLVTGHRRPPEVARLILCLVPTTICIHQVAHFMCNTVLGETCSSHPGGLNSETSVLYAALSATRAADSTAFAFFEAATGANALHPVVSMSRTLGTALRSMSP